MGDMRPLAFLFPQYDISSCNMTSDNLGPLFFFFFKFTDEGWVTSVTLSSSLISFYFLFFHTLYSDHIISTTFIRVSSMGIVIVPSCGSFSLVLPKPFIIMTVPSTRLVLLSQLGFVLTYMFKVILCITS